MKKYILSFLVSFFTISVSYSQVSLVQFSTGYNSPVDIQNAGDDRLFIVEQAGTIRICDAAGVRKTTPFLNITSLVLAGGERGLLGLAFDPDYKNSGFFYVNYTRKTDGYTRISRFKVSAANPDSADPNSEQILLTIRQPFVNHNGGGIAFNPQDHYLYIGMGDGGGGGDTGNYAQNMDSLLGKMLRIDVSTTAYSIPSDNPFVGKPGRDEIWAVGMRNPWRWSFDRWNYDLWIGDVGQDAWEEINYQKASSAGGENYGWRCYEGNHSFNITGCGSISSYVAATYEFAHSGNAAVVGGYVYRGAEFSNMFGKYFLTDEFTGSYGFRSLTPNGSGGFTPALLGALGRTTIVTFGEDRWGEIYVAEYGTGAPGTGSIYKFQGQACSPVAFISDSANVYVCDTVSPYFLRTPDGNGFHYQWYANGAPVASNDNDSLLITAVGSYYVTVTNSNSCTATSSAVNIIYPQTLSVSGLDTLYCADHAPVSLTGNPSGGTFSGPGISNQTFDPAAAAIGNNIISYTYTNNISGCTASLTKIVKVDPCLNTTDYTFPSQLKLYPNPNQGDFTLSFYLHHSGTLNLEIKDVLGRSVFKEQRLFSSGFQSIQLKTGLLAKGVYTISMAGENGSSAKGFVVQ